MRCHCERRMAMWSAAVHRVGSRTRLQRLSVEPAHPPVGPDIVGRPGFSASGFGEGTQGGGDSADTTDPSGRRCLNGVLSEYRGRNLTG